MVNLEETIIGAFLLLTFIALLCVGYIVIKVITNTIQDIRKNIGD